MMKSDYLMKDIVSQAIQALHLLLAKVPVIKILAIEHDTTEPNKGMDIEAHIDVYGRRHALICEVKSTGQPRHVRIALLQLRNYMAHHAQDATPIFIAPYLSPEAQALCCEQDVGFIDLEGNARLIFGSVFIERQVASKPAADRRELKSLFKPKSAQVLRVMLRNPSQAWRVTDLAQAAAVSLGHVSNVRVGLLDREWAQVSEEGLFLSEPEAMLDEWRDAYEPPVGKRLAFYTTLYGSAFEEAARRALRPDGEACQAAFSSFSAAHWIAPFGRTGTQYFYANEAGLERLQSALKLSASAKGENVVITLLKDSGLLLDTEETAPGAICTSPVQTYLDLASAGERGREAADHLRRERLIWPK
jgi:hypothetical protein